MGSGLAVCRKEEEVDFAKSACRCLSARQPSKSPQCRSHLQRTNAFPTLPHSLAPALAPIRTQPTQAG